MGKRNKGKSTPGEKKRLFFFTYRYFLGVYPLRGEGGRGGGRGAFSLSRGSHQSASRKKGGGETLLVSFPPEKKRGKKGKRPGLGTGAPFFWCARQKKGGEGMPISPATVLLGGKKTNHNYFCSVRPPAFRNEAIEVRASILFTEKHRGGVKRKGKKKAASHFRARTPKKVEKGGEEGKSGRPSKLF